MKAEDIEMAKDELKKLGAYNKFIKAYSKYHECKECDVFDHMSDHIEDIFEFMINFSSVEKSFNWAGSSDGYNYWSDINVRLRNNYLSKDNTAKKAVQLIKDNGIFEPLCVELFASSAQMESGDLLMRSTLINKLGVIRYPEMYMACIYNGRLFSLSRSRLGSGFWIDTTYNILRKLETPQVMRIKRAILMLKHKRILSYYAAWIKDNSEGLMNSLQLHHLRTQESFVFSYLIRTNYTTKRLTLSMIATTPPEYIDAAIKEIEHIINYDTD